MLILTQLNSLSVQTRVFNLTSYLRSRLQSDKSSSDIFPRKHFLFFPPLSTAWQGVPSRCYLENTCVCCRWGAFILQRGNYFESIILGDHSTMSSTRVETTANSFILRCSNTVTPGISSLSFNFPHINTFIHGYWCYSFVLPIRHATIFSDLFPNQDTLG